MSGRRSCRPQSGWLPLAFALDWSRPPRQQNSTSFFYAHTDQWRYETLDVGEIISPTAPAGPWDGALIDYNVRAERMGWLPSAPQLETNPLEVAKKAAASGKEPKDYVAGALKSGELKLSCHDPDNPRNWPRNMFVWRSNLLGSSGKGHEYFLKHLLGTSHGVMGKQLGEMGAQKPTDVVWHERGAGRKARPAGDARLPHVDHVRLLRHRAADGHLVREERSQHLRHAPLHPSADRRGGPGVGGAQRLGDLQGDRQEVLAKSHRRCWASRRIWCSRRSCTTRRPRSPRRSDVKDWKRGECEPVAGKTMPAVTVVERDYPNLYKRFTSLGPLMSKLGNGGKGMAWNTEHEVDFLKRLNGVVTDEGPTKGLPKIDSDIDAAEVILTLAPETNGEVAVKAWASLGGFTGREHTHLAVPKEDEKIRFRDVVAQPRKIISSPVWSGLESDKVCYNAGYTNVHELIPWRTLTGRQQLYQDHLWMRAFGEALCVYRPPIDTRSVKPVIDTKPNGEKQIVLNFITPHQKWGIHSTYTDNLLMLTLSRGGPIVWISEKDARLGRHRR